MARLQFESFVSRVRDAVQRAMPEAHAEVVRAEAQIQRPNGKETAAAAPTSPHYDPYDSYYPSPLSTMMNIMMWSTIFSMAMPPHVTVINHEGAPVGVLKVWIGDTLSQETPLFAAESIGVGALYQRAFDAIGELMVGWMRKPASGN